MNDRSRAARHLSLLAIAAIVAAIVGWASVGAGGYYPHGTATAAEREVGSVAVVVGVGLALALLKVVAGNRRRLEPAATAMATAIAALPLAVPAMWALGYPVSTPAADSFGCGTVTSPEVPAVTADTPSEVGDSCRTRLTQQRVLAGVLALPPLAALGVALVQVVREREPQGDSDSEAVIHG